MCALCSLAGLAAGGLNCEDLSRDPGLPSSDAASGTLSAAAGAPPAFSLAQIIQQLQTQWGGAYEGTTEHWPGTGPIPYYIGGTPYASGSGEISYWTTMTALMTSRAALAFELWDDLIARDLNPAATAASAQIQFEYATRTYNGSGVLSTNGGTYEFGWYNGTSSNSYGTTNYNLSRAEIWLNSNWTSHNADNDMVFGGYGFQTYMHEIGHALGLSHPGTYNAGSGGTITYANSAEYSLDNRQYTIMSYFGGYAPGAGWQQDGTASSWLYSSTPMLHDVAAVQSIYGADMTTRAGDTIYGFHSNAGRDVFDFTIDKTPIVTVWDAGGIDTIDLSGYSASERIDLHGGAYSDVAGMLNNFAIAYNVTIENAIGGSGSDTFYGNDANNRLTGGAGNDTMDGGAGTDTAVFSGAFASYSLVALGGTSIRVTGPDGVDILSNIELLQFGDQIVTSPSSNIDGGASNDTYVYTGGFGFFDGGAGSDTLDLSRFGSAVSVDLLVSQPEVWTRDAGDLNSGTWRALIDVTGVENVIGTTRDDSIRGDGNDNTYTYTGGFDVFDGGAGSDTLDLSRFGSAVSVDLLVSQPEVWTRDANDFNSGTWHPLVDLAGVENVIGTIRDDSIRGDGNANTYTYIGGFDVFDGGASSDTLDLSRFGSAVSVDLLVSQPEVWTRDANDLSSGTWHPLVDVTGVENVIGTVRDDNFRGDATANQFTGGGGNDTFVFWPGITNNDSIIDFNGNGAAAGDQLQFIGFGTGATFMQLDATHWQINYNGGLTHEVITFANAPGLHTSDWLFV